MKRKFAFGVEKVVVEANYFNGSIWKCFENFVPVDAPSPPSTVISPVRKNEIIFKNFHQSIWVCNSTYLFKVTFAETLLPCLLGSSQRVYCSNNWDKH